MDKKLGAFIAAGAMSIGIVSGAVIPAFASETTDAVTESGTEQTTEAVESNCEDRGAFTELDEETKAQAEAIMEELRDGTLTEEEAQTQLEALGTELPEFGGHRGKGGRHGGFGGALADLDEETKAQAEAIIEDLRDGTLTTEEAQTQLEALGIEVPEFDGGPLADLDEETRAQVESIFDQLRDGTLTEEEAQTELEALGVELPARPDGFGGHQGGHDRGFKGQQDNSTDVPATESETNAQETSAEAI